MLPFPSFLSRAVLSGLSAVPVFSLTSFSVFSSLTIAFCSTQNYWLNSNSCWWSTTLYTLHEQVTLWSAGEAPLFTHSINRSLCGLLVKHHSLHTPSTGHSVVNDDHVTTNLVLSWSLTQKSGKPYSVKLRQQMQLEHSKTNSKCSCSTSFTAALDVLAFTAVSTTLTAMLLYTHTAAVSHLRSVYSAYSSSRHSQSVTLPQ